MMGGIWSKEVNRSVGKFNQIDRNKLKNSFRLNNYTELNVERNNLERKKPGSRIVLSSSFSFRNEKIRWKKSAIFKRNRECRRRTLEGRRKVVSSQRIIVFANGLVRLTLENLNPRKKTLLSSNEHDPFPKRLFISRDHLIEDH